MKTKTINLNFKNKKVEIFLRQEILFSDFLIQKLKSYCQPSEIKNIKIKTSLKPKIALISDSTVATLYSEKFLSFLKAHNFDAQLFVFPASEKNKTRETKEQIEDALFLNGFRKNSLIISLGGGVTSDLASFIAATYFRGVKLILIPTTLLAMADAAIGGKGAVNTSYAKNAVGTIYHPEAIFIDDAFLKTLPQKELLNGYAEIIKIALLSDAAFFEKLKAKKSSLNLEPGLELIEKAILLKKEIVEVDETEENLRFNLNFGHTIGHALEKLENFQISHGQAIALGQIIESYLSMKLGILEKSDFFTILEIFKKYHFPLIFSQKISSQALEKALLLDKKANHLPRFILLNQIGQPLKNSLSFPIDPAKLKKALIWGNRRFASKLEENHGAETKSLKP